MSGENDIIGEWDIDHPQSDFRPTKESSKDTQIQSIKSIISEAGGKEDESEKVELIITSILLNLSTLHLWLSKHTGAPGFLDWSKKNAKLKADLYTLKKGSTDTKNSDPCIAKIFDLFKVYAPHVGTTIVRYYPEVEHPKEKKTSQKIMDAIIWLCQCLCLLICNSRNNPQQTQSNLNNRSLLLFKLSLFSNPHHDKQWDLKETLMPFDDVLKPEPTTRKYSSPTASTDYEKAPSPMTGRYFS